MANSFSVCDLIKRVQMSFGANPPGKAIVLGMLDRVIARMNMETDGLIAQKKVIGGASYTIAELTAANGELTIAENTAANGYGPIGTLGFTLDGYDYDTTEYALTVPYSVNKVHEVIVNDETWTQVNGDYLRDTSNVLEKVYAFVRGTIYFPYDVIDSNITLVVQENIPSLSVCGDDYTGLDERWGEMLVLGATYMCAILPKYRDETIANVSREEYERGLSKFKNRRTKKEMDYTPTYHWDYSY